MMMMMMMFVFLYYLLDDNLLFVLLCSLICLLASTRLIGTTCADHVTVSLSVKSSLREIPLFLLSVLKKTYITEICWHF